MILVDTSVWIEHLRHGNSHLQHLLLEGQVMCHPFIIGEVICGQLTQRSKIRTLLQTLPLAKTAQETEVFDFIEHKKLYQFGVGIVDVHLIASAILSHVTLWSFDKNLNKACEHCKVECYAVE